MDYVADPTLDKLYVEAGKALLQAAAAPAKNVVTSIFASLKGYEPYLRETYRKVSSFRSLVNPNQNISTIDHYVPACFSPASRAEPDLDLHDLIESLSSPKKYVISGFAGYGKSMAMRYIALSLFENPTGKIPLFVELRSLNRLGSPNLLAFINSTYAQGSAVDLKAFEKALEAGVFVLLLDGFDEVNHDIRHSVESQILQLSLDYPKNSLIISGRPNENRYSSWRDFGILKLKPMNKVQVVDLIGKLDFDPGVKRRFMAKLRGGLYESHESFLSTPLLAILMLLTFQKNANIPDKMYLFYGKAYETLFNQHDAMKEQYDRPRKSGLQIDEFQNFFSTFCLTTYVNEKTEFTQVEIVSAIRDALRYNDLKSDVTDVLYDMQESVCLVVNEGNSYFFIHRSFQEYFTAVFLSACAEADRDKFLDTVAPRHWDEVLPMLYDMASEQIESTWVRKRLDDYLAKVGTEAPKIDPVTAMWESIFVGRTAGSVEMIHFSPGEHGHFITTLGRFYPDTRPDMRLNGAAITEAFKECWDKVPFQSEEVYRFGDNDSVEREFSIKDLPPSVLEDGGLKALALAQFEALKKLSRRLSRARRSRESFLDSVFST